MKIIRTIMGLTGNTGKAHAVEVDERFNPFTGAAVVEVTPGKQFRNHVVCGAIPDWLADRQPGGVYVSDGEVECERCLEILNG